MVEQASKGQRTRAKAPQSAELGVGEVLLHPQWSAWVAENLARGARAGEIVDALAGHGLPRERAEALVRALSESPGVLEARRLWNRVEALEQIIRLRREHRASQGTGYTSVCRGPLPSTEEFIARYWVPGVPAIFTDLVPRWPAFSKWSLAYLAEHFGDVLVQACVGRDTIEDPDPEWARIERDLPVRTLVEMLRAPGTGNDVYVIAKNAAFRRPGLAPLLTDVEVPEDFFGPKLDPCRMGLWIGSAGTHTPLHHDGDNVMFCQVVGRKRFRIAPPEALALLEQSRGVYSTWDPTSPEELREGPTTLLELVLAPGEALFIPAGWWHQVDAIDASISVSILEFAWPNDHAWYKPGTVLAGRKA